MRWFIFEEYIHREMYRWDHKLEFGHLRPGTLAAPNRSVPP
jgi:hypothetical protein